MKLYLVYEPNDIYEDNNEDGPINDLVGIYDSKEDAYKALSDTIAASDCFASLCVSCIESDLKVLKTISFI